MAIRIRFGARDGERGLPGKIFGSLFFLPFLGIGIWITGLMILGLFRMASAYGWDEAECLILRSEVEEPRDADSAYRFRVAYTYVQRGHRYSSEQYQPGYSGSTEIAAAHQLADRYPVGSRARCWVDRRHPEKAMLRRPNLWVALFLPLPLIFVAVGGIGLYSLWRPKQARELIAGGTDRAMARLGPRGCMILFFAAFFLAGAGFSLFFIGPALRVVQARSWAAVPCTILASEVRTHPSSDSDSGPTYSVAVRYTYLYQGREHTSDRYQFLGGSSGGYAAKERIVRRLPPLTRTTCYVNPDDPAEAVLNRDFNSEYAFVLVTLLFMAVGLGGMIFAIRGGLANATWQRR